MRVLSKGSCQRTLRRSALTSQAPHKGAVRLRPSHAEIDEVWISALRDPRRHDSLWCEYRPRLHDQLAFALVTGAIDRVVDREPRDFVDFPVVRRGISASAFHQVEMHALE